MNLDERLEKIGIDLERLKERHEALTESVELISRVTEENSRMLRGVLEAISELTRIVSSHENRLDRLEGNAPA